MLVATILNEALWLQMLEARIGREKTLSLSSITLIPLLVSIAYVVAVFLDWHDVVGPTVGVMIWVSMTVAFEFLFWHYVMKVSWDDIKQRFDVEHGDGTIWLVLLVAAVPWLGSFIYWYQLAQA